MTDHATSTETDDASPATPSLTIDAPDRSRTDDQVEIQITGADPGATVEFEAILTDDDGITWESNATFVADDGVNLSTTQPTDGTWRHAHPMAWLWSMRTEANEMGPSLGDDPTVAIALRAESDGRDTTKTIERELYDPEITRTDIDRDGLVGTLFEPPGGGPASGVIHLHGSAGRMSHYASRLLASKGFAVLALDYVGDSAHLPDTLANISLEYVDGAANWLLDRPGVGGDRLGLVGVSRGAEAAILLGARRDWVGAVVSYAGSGVPWDTPHDEPAWLDDGEPVPHIQADDDHPNRTNLDEKPLADRLPAVEQTNGPILLLSGGSDPVWDARRLSEVVIERLDAAAFPHDSEHLTYDDVGHYIGIPSLPLGGFGALPRMRATAHASEGSWPVVLDYLWTGLGEPEDDPGRPGERR